MGGQPSSGLIIDLTSIAKACGYQTPESYIEKKEDLQAAVQELSDKNHLCLIDVHVRQGIRKDMPKLSIDHKAQKKDLMESLMK